jgi:hypothetical protein
MKTASWPEMCSRGILEAAKGPIETLIADRAEKPSAN